MHRDHLLGEDRPGVHFERGQVHGAAGLRHARGQGVAHPVPAGEGGEERRMGVQDPVGKGAVHGLGHDRAEARHGHQIHPVGQKRGGDRLGVGGPIEVGPEPAVGLPVDELVGRPLRTRQRQRGTGTVRDDRGDRETGVEHGLQDRPAPRDEDTNAHDGHASAPATTVRSGAPR